MCTFWDRFTWNMHFRKCLHGVASKRVISREYANKITSLPPQCVDGFPYLNRCPSGLYFDDISKFCTFKVEARCGPIAASEYLFPSARFPLSCLTYYSFHFFALQRPLPLLRRPWTWQKDATSPNASCRIVSAPRMERRFLEIWKQIP